MVKYWIGGNDLASKNRWVWAETGYRIYPFVNWKPPMERMENMKSMGNMENMENMAAPSGKNRCLSVDAISFQWIASNCEEKNGFFCEKGKVIKKIF